MKSISSLPWSIPTCLVCAALWAVLLASCDSKPNASPPAVTGSPDSASAGPPGLDKENRLAAIPLGDKATGGDKNQSPVRNPYGDSPQAVQEGKKLFASMNCAGCHTYTGKGWMGPNLTDAYWRYGGGDDEIYKSIYEGRPQGMPAWGKSLPPHQIWQLVAYLKSLAEPGGGNHVGTGAVPATGTGRAIDQLPPGAEGSNNNPAKEEENGAIRNSVPARPAAASTGSNK
jgi:mono/diheme cytochrome c family protein